MIGVDKWPLVPVGSVRSAPIDYARHTLSKGLPQSVQESGRSPQPGNVTATCDLPPISAALIAYNFGMARKGRKRGSIMRKVAAKMAKKPAKTAPKTKDTGNTRKLSGDSSGLAHCYRQIGISAVVAAVRYQGVAKNPAYAPAPNKWHDRADEAAA